MPVAATRPSPADGALIGEQPGDFVRIRHPDTPLTQVASIAGPSMENAGKAWLRDKAQAPRAHRMARSAIRRRITLWQPGNPAIRRRIDRRGVPAELLVRYLVQDRGHLADPAAVVEAADEAAVARVAGHVHELLGRDQGPEPGEIAVLGVAHDPTDNPGQLAPLALGERLGVARDGDQEGRCGAGDRVRQHLLGLRPSDHLLALLDDQGDPIAPDADDVAAASHGCSFEVARPSIHLRAY